MQKLLQGNLIHIYLSHQGDVQCTCMLPYDGHLQLRSKKCFGLKEHYKILLREMFGIAVMTHVCLNRATLHSIHSKTNTYTSTDYVTCHLFTSGFVFSRIHVGLHVCLLDNTKNHGIFFYIFRMTPYVCRM